MSWLTLLREVDDEADGVGDDFGLGEVDVVPAVGVGDVDGARNEGSQLSLGFGLGGVEYGAEVRRGVRWDGSGCDELAELRGQQLVGGENGKRHLSQGGRSLELREGGVDVE